jgi:predicted Rossmann fold nucleotide-binding protein DprA/Smf involved in DNA uptake
MDDASSAVRSLTNKLVDVGVAPFKASELWRLLDQVDDPSTLVGRSAAEISRALDRSPAEGERIATLLDSGVALAVRLDALRDRGIWAITAFDPTYPAGLRHRLGLAAPPVLFGAGEVGLLGAPGIGVTGTSTSTDEVSDDAADVARSVALLAVHEACPVITGGVTRIDDDTMRTAEQVGGASVAVLAGSLEAAISRAETRRALMRGQRCLCTPYRPDVAYTAASARGRNKIVHALGRITLVVAVEPDDTDATGAREAIDKGYGIVAVWRGAGAGPGNDALETAGAHPITAVADLIAAPA